MIQSPNKELLFRGMRLNLCCGIKLKEGFINVDVVYPNDVEADLTKEWTFGEDSVSEIYMSKGLEHFLDIDFIIKEMIRVCHNKAKIIIIVPFGTNGFCSIYHHHYFNWNTFKALQRESGHRLKLINQEPYNTQERGVGSFRNYIPKWLCKLLSYFNHIFVEHIKVELEVNKL